MELTVGDRKIGRGQPCFIIAEVGLAHDGSLGAAHAYISAVKRMGADAVKFQCHTGDTATEWRVEPRWPQDENRQAYWKRTAFTVEQWWGLWDHCRQEGITFLCSPFSVEAVGILERLVPLWKVPSGKIADWTLLTALANTKKPILLSTGMSTKAEADAAMMFLAECQVGLMQCTTAYPCPPALIGMENVKAWGGLSDHSGTIYPSIAAAALGCQVLEVHVTFNRAGFGLDGSASLTLEELGQVVRGVRFIEAALAHVDKDTMAARLKTERRIFMGAA